MLVFLPSCHKCYKFETHSDIEVASVADLEVALAQDMIELRWPTHKRVSANNNQLGRQGEHDQGVELKGTG